MTQTATFTLTLFILDLCSCECEHDTYSSKVIMKKKKTWSGSQVSGFVWKPNCDGWSVSTQTCRPRSPSFTLVHPLVRLLSFDLGASSPVCQMGLSLHVMRPRLWSCGFTASCSSARLRRWTALRNCPGGSWTLLSSLFIFIYYSPSPLHLLSLSICFFLVIFLLPGLISTIIKFSLLHFRLTLSLPEYQVFAEEASLRLTCL